MRITVVDQSEVKLKSGVLVNTDVLVFGKSWKLYLDTCDSVGKTSAFVWLTDSVLSDGMVCGAVACKPTLNI